MDFVIVMAQQPGSGNSQELHCCSVVPLTSSHCTSLCVHSTSLCSSTDHFKVLHPFTALSATMTETAPSPPRKIRCTCGFPNPLCSQIPSRAEQTVPLKSKNSCCTAVPFMQFASITPCLRPQYWHFTPNFFKLIEKDFFFKHF